MKIVLSADDFGRSHERNLAIDYAMKNGLIKSAALMVNSNYSDEAVEFAKRGVFREPALSFEPCVRRSIKWMFKTIK